MLIQWDDEMGGEIKSFGWSNRHITNKRKTVDHYAPHKTSNGE